MQTLPGLVELLLEGGSRKRLATSLAQAARSAGPGVIGNLVAADPGRSREP